MEVTLFWLNENNQNVGPKKNPNGGKSDITNNKIFSIARKNNLSGDDEILKRSTNYCLLSIDKYEEIESNLELAEVITLYNLVNELRNIDKRKKIFDESTVTINWLVHVRNFIERICTNE